MTPPLCTVCIAVPPVVVDVSGLYRCRTVRRWHLPLSGGHPRQHVPRLAAELAGEVIWSVYFCFRIARDHLVRSRDLLFHRGSFIVYAEDWHVPQSFCFVFSTDGFHASLTYLRIKLYVSFAYLLVPLCPHWRSGVLRASFLVASFVFGFADHLHGLSQGSGLQEERHPGVLFRLAFAIPFVMHLMHRGCIFIDHTQ